MRFCEECGAQLEDDAKFCEECGTEVVILEEEDEVTAGEEKAEEPVALFCEECGAKLEPGVRFCEECGTPVGGTVEGVVEAVEEEPSGEETPEEEPDAVVEEIPVGEPEIEVVEEMLEEEPEETPFVEIEEEEEAPEEEISEDVSMEVIEDTVEEPEIEVVEELQEEVVEEVPATEPIVTEQKEITPPIIEKQEATKQPKNKLVGVLIAIIGVLLVVIVALVLLGLNKFGLDDKEKEANSGNNVVVGEDNTNTTPTPEVIVTATPKPTVTPKSTVAPTKKPTATPKSTATPKPTVAPTTMPTATVAPKPTAMPTPSVTPEELFAITEPKWRDLLTDSEDIKKVKQELRQQGAYVEYIFKDRMDNKGLITQVRWLEDPENELRSISIYSYQTKQRTRIDAEVCVMQGGLIQFSEDYLNSLPDGFYEIEYGIDVKAKENGVAHSQTWYVAESDVYQEPEQWLYDWHKTFKKNYACVSVVVRPDSSEKIAKLTWKDGVEIDTSLYEVLQEGRVLRLSPELIQHCITLGKRSFAEFLVHSASGRITDMDVRIESAPMLTPTPKPTVTPEPAPIPTATPTPTPKPTLEEINRTTAPEWRENSADSDKVKAMKESVRSGNITVEHFFKDRAEGKGLIIHEPKIDDPGVRFDELRVYSYETNEEKIVDKKYYQIQEDLIIISEAFIDSLSDGFYVTYHIMSQKGADDNKSIVMSQTWYIAESDVYQEPESWLYWDNPTYKDDLEYTNVTVKADSTKVISKLHWDDGSEVDKSLYEIHFDGRVLRISKALLQQCVKLNKWEFCVFGTDGSEARLRFWPE